MVSLTSYLYSLSTPRPYSAATEHNFLTAAGNGTVSPKLFGFWLAQDRLYAAHAYPRFIGRLIAGIPWSSTHAPGSKEEQLNQTILRVLVYSLQNVVREVGFFDEYAKKFDLQIDHWRERKETRDYTAEMARISAEGDILDGLVFVWAMEQVYLDAWRYAASVQERSSVSEDHFTRAFVANWTNDEFVKFVNDLAGLVNSFDVKPGTERFNRLEMIWLRVVELEEAFWPNAGEELAMGHEA
ncbi:hypothetical protein EWM64_g2126 [Hericium alpestre]|uniref:Thiaminase-2/PQQC domain-containing protein n=1 Tax=Hericium alpestre TaxID=135208 RepID=A0A4Z0A6A6_9AGAM|nr:hypothetical protein EWM64_g2126 [Hericium alpestre]